MDTSGLTPIEDWLDGFEEVTLPSGRRVGLRPVDVLSILTEDGQVPNFLMPVIEGYMSVSGKAAEQPQENMSAEEVFKFEGALNRLTEACWVWPPLTEDMAVVQKRKGIMLHMIPLMDKVALITWAMGGQAALDAGKKALAEQTGNLAVIQSGNGVQPATERDPEHTE